MTLFRNICKWYSIKSKNRKTTHPVSGWKLFREQVWLPGAQVFLPLQDTKKLSLLCNGQGKGEQCEHLSCRGSPSGIFLGLHSGFDISRVHRITVFDCQKFYKIRATGPVMQSSEWFSLNMFVILTFHCSRRQTKNTNKSMKTPTKPFYLAYCVFVPNASI